jgi:hypothetical protein
MISAFLLELINFLSDAQLTYNEYAGVILGGYNQTTVEIAF